jgi:uncharacterized protein YbjT (DUF2867 family)
MIQKIASVCVIGGAGFVGRHIVRLLQACGYSVRVPTRRYESAKDLIVLPDVEVIEANIHDPQALAALLSGMDAVINLTGILHEGSAGRGTFQQVHVALPGKIAQACAAQGVQRLLHMSALGADAQAKSAYLRSKAEGEAAVRAAEALAVTVFRPSVIFGPEDNFLNQFAALLRRLPVLALACGDSKLQPVFVEDVARAFVSSLENLATVGQTYAVCGPKVYSLQQLVQYVSALQQRRRWIFTLGKRASYYQAWLLEKLPGKLMTRDDYHALLGNSVCDGAFPAVFGFQPTALEGVAAQYLGPQAMISPYDAWRGRARR